MIFAAAERNATPILETLIQHVPLTTTGYALEVASGTGQHVAKMAAAYRHMQWQPSEVDGQLMDSIREHTAPVPNVRPPVRIDVAAESWWTGQLPADWHGKVQLLVCVNLLHISAWCCSRGLFAGAGQLLAAGTGDGAGDGAYSGGTMMIYGPFACDGVLRPESNVRFDAGLRGSCADWGVRDISDLKLLAAEHGLKLVRQVEMPANNKCLFWKRC